MNLKKENSESMREKRERFYVVRSMTYVHRIKSKGLHCALINLIVYNTKVSIYRV